MSGISWLDYVTGDATLQGQQLDGGAGDETIYLVDFLDENTYAAGAVPTGALAAGMLLKNLGAVAGNTASLTTAFPGGIGAAGLVFNTASQHVALPAACKLAAATVAHFVFGITLKRGVDTGGAGSFTPWAGDADNTSSVEQWVIQQPANAADDFMGAVGGVQCMMTSPVNEVHQLIWEAILSGGILTLNGYKDGEFSNTASGALATLPLPSAAPVLGNIGIYGSASPIGELGRFTFADLTLPGAQPIEDIIANEFAQIAGPRFS